MGGALTAMALRLGVGAFVGLIAGFLLLAATGWFEENPWVPVAGGALVGGLIGAWWKSRAEAKERERQAALGGLPPPE